VNELLEKVTEFIQSRTARERWLAVLVACVTVALLVQGIAIGPIRASLSNVERETEDLAVSLQRSERMAREIQRLQTELAMVESRIKPGERANLFTLLENLAAQARIKDQLESIKPKQASGNEMYPETRVEVSIKGATLNQTVQFLYQIESAPVLLIIRSLRIKSRNDDSKLLDVSFAVSSFERA
jgi:Tfp pilus assembly protein PilO